MRIDHPAPEQMQQLRGLWKLAFGDSDSFLDKFYSSAYAPERCRCITESQRIAAALYWFDAEYAGQKIAYLYAVATHPDFRQRGLCRMLMADTHTLLSELGYTAAMLLPDGNDLRQMYAGMGYRDCCCVSEFTSAAGSVPTALHTVDRKTYAQLRRKLLPESGVIQEGANLAYLETYARLYAGEDFLLAAMAQEDSLRCLELLGNRNAAPGILRTLGYETGTFRTPGGDVPFAMLRPLKEKVKAPRYFGLVFD